MSRVVFSSLIVMMVLTCSLTASAGEDGKSEGNWPRFRGPDGSGHSSDARVPTSWDASGVTWKVELPVTGHSSPAIWGDRIFVTGASNAGGVVKRHVVCLDRRSGRLLWNQVAATGSGERLHKMNSWATPSCATDGERVVAFFGAGGLHCFGMEGQTLWSRELGDFPGAWGVGASPIILGDMVVQNCDALGDSFLLAVDKKTGKDIWRTPRRSKPRGGWSTPIVIETAGQRELVLNGEFGVQAYDLDSGKPNWFCKSFNGRGTPAPVWGHGNVYVVNGKSGDVYAVKPGGEGDVTDTHMAWHTPRKGGRDLPSPVLVGDSLLAVSMSGVVTCYETRGGEELWKARLGGNFSGSPVVVAGRVYVAAENGDVMVVQAGPKFELIARNEIGAGEDEVFRSSLAVSNGQFFLRSDKRLYCIGKTVDAD